MAAGDRGGGIGQAVAAREVAVVVGVEPEPASDGAIRNGLLQHRHTGSSSAVAKRFSITVAEARVTSSTICGSSKYPRRTATASAGWQERTSEKATSASSTLPKLA